METSTTQPTGTANANPHDPDRRSPRKIAWTDQPPTESGYYWYLEDAEDAEPEIIEWHEHFRLRCSRPRG